MTNKEVFKYNVLFVNNLENLLVAWDKSCIFLRSNQDPEIWIKHFSGKWGNKNDQNNHLVRLK